MNHQECLALYRKQLSRLREIAEENGLNPDSHNAQDALRELAEYLLVCPSEDEAIRRMKSDRETTRAFLRVASKLDAGWPKTDTAPSKTNDPTMNPFYAVALSVLDAMKGAKDTGGTA